VVQKLDELFVPMARHATLDYFTSKCVAGGKQSGRAVPAIIVRLSRGNASSQRRDRRRSLECLDSALFVNAQNNRIGLRIHVETNNIAQLRDEVGVRTNALYTGDHLEWRVPIDDENMLSVTWHFARVPKEQEPFEQTSIPTWHGPVKDELTGKWITSHVMNQDFVAWLGQGKISDRWNEHLGSSDRGVIMVRNASSRTSNAWRAAKTPKRSCAIPRPTNASPCRSPTGTR
jgi:hypothetical protein